MIDLLKKFTSKGNRRELCPYCFEHFYLRETPFRCSSPATKCTHAPDPVLKEKWGDVRPVGKVIETGGQYVKAIKCPDCKHKSHDRICPHCHSKLPPNIGDSKHYIFAVIGAKEAGKSHYIAVLINQIQKEIGPDMNMLLAGLNDETMSRYRNEFYKPIFQQKQTIQATHSALAGGNIQKPMLYSLTMTGKGLFGGTRIKKSIVLVFFDTAGEDLNAQNTMETVNKYIYRSDGIILLIDPLQLTTVRDRLVRGTGLPGINAETADILNRVVRLIRNGREIDDVTKIPTPIAIAFSKFDAVEPIVDEQLQLNHEPDHNGGFDYQDFETINTEMEALLEDWGEQNIVFTVKTHFERYGFFGLSALGCNPHELKSIPRVVPHRVADPFLWLLHENDLIGRKEQ